MAHSDLAISCRVKVERNGHYHPVLGRRTCKPSCTEVGVRVDANGSPSNQLCDRWVMFGCTPGPLFNNHLAPDLVPRIRYGHESNQNP
jgi:hypothetical protein